MARKKHAYPLVETTVTYLEMREPPSRPTVAAPMTKLAIMRAGELTVSFYRYLYNTVGEPWSWTERRLLDDRALGKIVENPLVEVYVLYAGGAPAGFVELDKRRDREVELAYCGLIPEFIGRGLGSYLLDWAVHAAWLKKPERVWVHTCTHDHPRALSVYQRAGFEAYERRVEKIVPIEALLSAPPSGGESG